MFKPFCHQSQIVFSTDSPLVFTCEECGKEQVGFLGFLYLIAIHSNQTPTKMIGKGKKFRKPPVCSLCKEIGHRSRYCPQNPKNKKAYIGETEKDDENDDDEKP